MYIAGESYNRVAKIAKFFNYRTAGAIFAFTSRYSLPNKPDKCNRCISGSEPENPFCATVLFRTSNRYRHRSGKTFHRQGIF
jgi:hypothetical protein